MKKILSILLTVGVCAFSLVLTSCGDDEKTSPPSPNPNDGTACVQGESIYCVDGVYQQPKIVIGEGVDKQKLTVDVEDAEGNTVTYTFKDSDGDGTLDKYEDWRLSASDRAQDLIYDQEMSTDYKIAFLFEIGYGMGPGVGGSIPTDGVVPATNATQITEFKARFSMPGYDVNLSNNIHAKFLNNVQKLAEAADYGVPVVTCVDPATGWGINQNVTGYETKNDFKVVGRWCYNLGLGAINDPEYVREIAALHAKAYKANGIFMLLGPMCDVLTEPRWARVYDTMGSDPEIVGNNVKAYIQGLQGSDDGNGLLTMAATIKHFPGGGANEEGLDSHTFQGRFAANDGNGFEAYVNAFGKALEAKPACLMPCYSIFHNATYKGNTAEELKTSHHVEEIMIDILQEEFKYEGMITSDWNAVTGEMSWGGMPATASFGACNYGWPTAEATVPNAVESYVACGGHQIGAGGPNSWEQALESGQVTEDDVSRCAKKCVEVTFKLGLFENPYVDEEKADETMLGLEDKIAEVTKKAMVLVKNQNSALPVDAGLKVYFDGVDDDTVSYFSGITKTNSLADADVAVIRLAARKGDYYGVKSPYVIQATDPERYGGVGKNLGGGVPIGFNDIIKTYFPDADPGSEDNTRGEPYIDQNQEMSAGWGSHNPYQVRNQAMDGIRKLQRAIAARDTGGAAESTPVEGTNETYWDTDATNPIDCDTNGDGDYDDAGFAANSNLKIVACVFGVRPFEYHEVFNSVDAMVVEFGINDENLLSALLGEDDFSFSSKLPYGLPANNAVVEAAKEDLSEDESSIPVARGTGITGW